MAPSVSYSITVRLEVASRGRAVSEITRAVEQAGGVVTALDVTAGRARLRLDVTCAARDTAHADAIVSALGAIPDVTCQVATRPPASRRAAQSPHAPPGDLAGAMRGADVFIGLSAPGILSGADIAAMAPNAVVFALANPDPEVVPRTRSGRITSFPRCSTPT